MNWISYISNAFIKALESSQGLLIDIKWFFRVVTDVTILDHFIIWEHIICDEFTTVQDIC